MAALHLPSTFPCGRCRYPLPHAPSVVGTLLRCKCGGWTVVPASPPPPPAAGEITYHCPTCRRRSIAAETGRVVRCPFCDSAGLVHPPAERETVAEIDLDFAGGAALEDTTVVDLGEVTRRHSE